ARLHGGRVLLRDPRRVVSALLVEQQELDRLARELGGLDDLNPVAKVTCAGQLDQVPTLGLLQVARLGRPFSVEHHTLRAVALGVVNIVDDPVDRQALCVDRAGEADTPMAIERPLVMPERYRRAVPLVFLVVVQRGTVPQDEPPPAEGMFAERAAPP